MKTFKKYINEAEEENKKDIERKDTIGQDISIGDKVAFAIGPFDDGTLKIMIGKIINVTKDKRFYVRADNNNRESIHKPSSLLKI